MALVLLTACGGTRSPVEATRQAGQNALAHARIVEIRQNSEGCDPHSISVNYGETIRLSVVNETDSEYRLGVLDGRLNDLIVPANGTSSTYYGVPSSGPTLQLRCYVQGGVSTTIGVVPK